MSAAHCRYLELKGDSTMVNLSSENDDACMNDLIDCISVSEKEARSVDQGARAEPNHEGLSRHRHDLTSTLGNGYANAGESTCRWR